MLTITDTLRYGASQPQSWLRGYGDKLENLIDLIELRVARDGVEKTMNSLLDEVFELRMLIFPEFLKGNNQQHFQDFVLDSQLELRTENSDQHDQLYAQVLLVHHQMFYQSLLEQSPQQQGGLLLRDDGHTEVSTDFQSFLKMLQYLNAPAAYKQLLEASLKADFNALLYELLRSDRLPTLQKHKNEFVNLAFKYTEETGFYAALLDLWKPRDDSEEPLIRNIKIRLALYQLDTSQETESLSLEQLKSALLS